MPRKVSKEVKEAMREYYRNNPISISALAKKFKTSSPVAGEICKDIPRWTKTKIFSPDLRENWFEKIDTEEKAYYLGFFITDGNVCTTDKTQSICSLSQNSEDSYILKRWLNLVGSNRSVAEDGRGTCQASVLSDKMAKDLSAYGVIPNKTNNTFLPKIDDSLMPHLIRGILDGDGSVEARWHLFPDGRMRFKHKISFCGSHLLMEQLNSFLCERLDLKVKKDVYDFQGKNLSEIQYTNYEDIQKIGNYLYQDATIYLERKKILFDTILERITERQQCANH